MKILVVCQHYWPEPYPLADICEGLVRRGHLVHVLTGVPNYPMGRIYAGYRYGKNRRQTKDGVSIERTFTIGRRRRVFFRLLNYYSYSLSSALRVRSLPDDFDVVLCYQTSPVMMARAAMRYAKRHNKGYALYCLDPWPASLSAGGIRPGSPIYRYFGRVSRRMYEAADLLLISSPAYRQYLAQVHGIPESRLRYLPQYAPGENQTLPAPGPKDSIDLVFAGNIGLAQDMPTLLRAACLLQAEAPALHWHIAGEGSELAAAKELAGQLGLNNLRFYGRQSADKLAALYARADALLVLLRSDALLSMALPAKVQGYLAAGRPILACADGETRRVVEEAGCGWCAPAGDAEAFAQAVRRFLRCKDRQALGQNARTYYERHFSRDRFLDELERALCDCIQMH